MNPLVMLFRSRDNFPLDVSQGELLVVVRLPSRSTSPQWRSIRFRLAHHTYAPWGCIVRVVSQTKSSKNAHTKTFTAPFRAQDVLPGQFVDALFEGMDMSDGARTKSIVE